MDDVPIGAMSNPSKMVKSREVTDCRVRLDVMDCNTVCARNAAYLCCQQFKCQACSSEDGQIRTGLSYFETVRETKYSRTGM